MLPTEVRDRVVSYMQHQAGKPRDEIIALVAKSQQRYIDVVGALSDDAASRKPSPDEWSVRELIRHVISAQRGVASLVHHLSRGAAPPASDDTRGAGNAVPDDERGFAAFVDELRAVNETMLQAIRDLPASPNLTERAKHPFFGDLNCLEWAVFQRVHDEDHVQHAQKILAATA
jgi:hypothetical protein